MFEIKFSVITFFLFLLGLPLVAKDSIFTNEESLKRWQVMQKYYEECIQSIKDEPIFHKWCHPQWGSMRNQIAEIIYNKTPINFFKEPCIAGTMIRSDYGISQIFEETYLEYCIDSNTKNLIQQIPQIDANDLANESKKFNCSSNTLGHLFYLAKIIEHTSNKLKPGQFTTIIEVGGGYGNFAYLTKQAFPLATIIIIDLPEMNALQWFFLKSISPNIQIAFHTKVSDPIVAEAVNLIPLHLLEKKKLDTQIFVSTFALSECTECFQEYIAQKSFFNASFCYITGQLEGWGQEYNFVRHSKLFECIHMLYSTVTCQPFHIFSPTLKSYELIAQNN